MATPDLHTENTENEQSRVQGVGGIVYIKVRDMYFYGNDRIIQNYDPRPIMEELPKMKGRDDDVLVCGCHRSGKICNEGGDFIAQGKLRNSRDKEYDNIIHAKWRKSVVGIGFHPFGTNWTWEIVNMLVRETPQYQKDRKTPTLLEFQTQDYFEKMTSPRILSTHLRFHHIPDDMKKRKCKLIYIQRNPKDVAVSFRNYIKSEADLDVPWDEYLNSFVNAGEEHYAFWIGTTLSWDKAIRDNPDYPILLVYYEKMKQNPFDEITRMAKFLGVSTDKEFINEVVKKTSFSDMRNAKLEFLSQTDGDDKEDTLQRRKEYYRKGKVADWKNHFTVAQNEYFDKVMSERLKDTKLEFIYDI